MSKRIVLDKSTFKALATETRIEILKLLRQRKYMQSEIATQLGMSVPTIKEHLNAMEKASLVKMIDEGRKWKYYRLTPKGKALFEPEEEKHRIWIILSIFVLGVVGGFSGLIKSIFAPYYSGTQFAPELGRDVDEATDVATVRAEIMEMPPSIWANPWVYFYIGVLVILLGILLYRIWKYKKAKAAREKLFKNMNSKGKTS